MYKNIYSILLLYWFAQSLVPWELIHSSSPLGIQKLTINNRNEIYVTTNAGDIHSFDTKLQKSPLIFSPEFPVEPSLINADNYLNTMVFYQEIQEVIFLDRFLQFRNKLDLNLQINVFASAVAPASDGLLWVFNLSTQRLMKIDLTSGIVTVDLLVLKDDKDISLEITYLKEYQNLLFALDRQGKLFMIDLLGNVKKEIFVGGVAAIHLNDNQCFLLDKEGKEMTFFAIYGDDNSTLNSIELPEAARDALLKGEYLYLVTTDGRLRKYKHKKH